jgi:CDP-glycerol glycerophosphotransferase
MLKQLLAFINRVYKAGCRYIVWCLCYLIPIDKKKIVVSSYYGKGYGDNPKYIVEELLKLNSKIRIIWLVKGTKEKETLPKGVESCCCVSLKAIYHVSTARVWIDNCRKTFTFKKKSQFYIQTWHGFALKRIEGDVEDKLGQKYIKTAKKDSRAIDLIISEGNFMSEIYYRAFGYHGNIVEWGSPRNDLLIQIAAKRCDLVEKIYNDFHLENETKIILYAPTFRADNSLNAYSLDYTRLREVCQKRFGGRYIVFVRLHPNIIDKCSTIAFDGKKVVNASYYPDTQELLSVADIVISDYSSIMFDFALTGRPCFQFATDIDEYKSDRNFYFQIDSLPFALSTNNVQLERDILSFDQMKYKKKIETFLGDVGLNREGNSSKKCVNLIQKLTNEIV